MPLRAGTGLVGVGRGQEALHAAVAEPAGLIFGSALLIRRPADDRLRLGFGLGLAGLRLSDWRLGLAPLGSPEPPAVARHAVHHGASRRRGALEGPAVLQGVGRLAVLADPHDADIVFD